MKQTDFTLRIWLACGTPSRMENYFIDINGITDNVIDTFRNADLEFLDTILDDSNSHLIAKAIRTAVSWSKARDKNILSVVYQIINSPNTRNISYDNATLHINFESFDLEEILEEIYEVNSLPKTNIKPNNESVNSNDNDCEFLKSHNAWVEIQKNGKQHIDNFLENVNETLGDTVNFDIEPQPNNTNKANVIMVDNDGDSMLSTKHIHKFFNTISENLGDTVKFDIHGKAESKSDKSISAVDEVMNVDLLNDTNDNLLGGTVKEAINIDDVQLTESTNSEYGAVESEPVEVPKTWKAMHKKHERHVTQIKEAIDSGFSYIHSLLSYNDDDTISMTSNYSKLVKIANSLSDEITLVQNDYHSDYSIISSNTAYMLDKFITSPHKRDFNMIQLYELLLGDWANYKSTNNRCLEEITRYREEAHTCITAYNYKQHGLQFIGIMLTIITLMNHS